MSRYSDIVLDHFSNPRNYGKIPDADYVGTAGVPGRGRFLVLYLKMSGDRIGQVGFVTHGCGATIASGSVLTELISDCSVDECRELSSATLLEELHGLPPDKVYCASFALAALRNALPDA